MAVGDVIKALTPPFLVVAGLGTMVLAHGDGNLQAAGLLVLGSGLGAAPGAIGRRKV